MTLIVAIAHQGCKYIMGDTQIVFADARPNVNPVVDGCLKIYRCVDPRRAIAFAGTLSHFGQVAPAMLSAADSASCIRLAVQAQRQGLDFDALVVDTYTPSIAFVKGGNLSQSDGGFLGNHTAFEAFQRNYLSRSSAPFDPHRALMRVLETPMGASATEGTDYGNRYEALTATIDSKDVPGVAGVPIVLATRGDIFTYMHSTIISTDPLPLNVTRVGFFKNESPDSSSGWKPLGFGTAELGGCTVEICDDWNERDQSGGGEVGIYYLQGGFGVLFPPSATGIRYALSVEAPNPAHWSLEAKRRLGRPIASMLLNMNHCIIAGEHYLKAGNYSDALASFELGTDMRDVPLMLIDRFRAGYATALWNLDRRGESIEMFRSQFAASPNSPFCRAQVETVPPLSSHLNALLHSG